MRIITWNCKQKFREDYKKIIFLKPDVLVIQECESLEKINFDLFSIFPDDSYWIGDNTNKGLGVFTFNNFKISPIQEYTNELKYILPLKIYNNNNSFNLMGVWTQKLGEKTKNHINYIRQVQLSIKKYKPFLNSDNVIICGDFNSNLIWENPHRVDYDHKDVVESLERMNIFSSYHYFKNEDQGKELTPTYFHHHKREKPFHLDYCFLSKNLMDKLVNVEVGKFEDFIEVSDHLPIILDLNV